MNLKQRAIEILNEVANKREWSEVTRRDVVSYVRKLKGEEGFPEYVGMVFDKELGKLIEEGSKEIATNAVSGFKEHEKLNKISLVLTGKKLENGIMQLVQNHVSKVLKEPNMKELTARTMAAYATESAASDTNEKYNRLRKGELKLSKNKEDEIITRDIELSDYCHSFDFLGTDFRLPGIYFPEAIDKAMEGMSLAKFEKWLDKEFSYFT